MGLLLFLPAIAFCQKMPLRNFGQADGLDNLALTSLAQDKTGYIWIGTENGLYRHNGAVFLRYSKEEGLGEPFVTTLHIDHDDRLWVGTYDNLYVKSGQHFTRVLYGDKPLPVWPGQRIASLSNGSLLLISGGRLYSLAQSDGKPNIRPFFSATQIQQQPALKSLSSIYVEAPTSIWMGCGQFLCHSGPQGVTVWGASDGVPVDLWNNIVRGSKGQLWARGDHHIVSLPPQAQRFVDRSPPGDMLHKIGLVTALTTDAEGRVLSNSDRGLIRWNDDSWETFDTRNGLRIAGGLNALLFDKDGGMWMGARGQGLINWLGYGNWENWTSAQGLPDDVVLSFVRDKTGVLHIGTRSGPAHFRASEHRFAVSKGKSGNSDNQWSSLAVDRQGNVWGSTYTGLLMRHDIMTGADIEVAKLPLIHNVLNARDGRLWLATEEGIYIVDPISPGKAPYQPKELKGVLDTKGEDVLDLCQSANGDLWFLVYNRLLRFDGKKWKSFTVRMGAQDLTMFAMSCANDGALWLGSDQRGLLRAAVDNDDIQLAVLDSPMLHNKSVLAAYEDRRGWLWVGTDAGIAVWNRRQWVFANQNSGLVWNDTNGQVFYEESDGSMWIATSNGASHILRPESLFSDRPMNIVLEGITRNNVSVKTDASFSLPWESTALIFTLAVLQYRNHDAIHFRYRLKGLESAWSETDNAEIRYPALGPGHYVLQVIADNAVLQDVSSMKEVSFDITPLWWQTRYFYVICGLLIAALATVAYRYRVSRLLARQMRMEQLIRENRDKSKFVAEAAHDLRQPMQAIGNFIEAAEHALARQDFQKSRELMDLTKMGVSAMRSSFNSVLEISRLESGLIAADYAPFDLIEMVAEVTYLLTPLADERGVRIQQMTSKEKLLVVRSDRHLLSRVICNLLSNAIKYNDPAKQGNATVIVGVIALQDRCRVDIVDNGIGIPDSEQQNIFKPFFQIQNPGRDREKGIGLGLSIVNSIMLLLPDHRISMRSLERAGTRFSLEIPREKRLDSVKFVSDDTRAVAHLDLAGIYVLFVEDDVLVRASTEALFREFGILFDTSESLSELTKKLPFLERMPDIIFTDFSLPENRTAHDVVNIISAEFDVQIPIIVLTGDSERSASSQRLASAVILRKPVSATVLLNEINRLCPPRESVPFGK